MKRVAAIWIFLMAGAVLASAFAQNSTTGFLSGKIMTKEGVALAGGLVFFFDDRTGPPPLPHRYWRVPDEMDQLDGEGRFRVELAEGTYYVGAIKRAAEQRLGPPEDGDLFYISRNKDGKPKAFRLRSGEKNNIGAVTEAVTFHKGPTPADKTTSIEGSVFNLADGKPMEGALVYAYRTPEMAGKPLYVSHRSEKSGRFILRVAEGGTFYLKVRDMYGGGPPETGNIMGGYGEEYPTGIVVKTGETTKGISIPAIRFPGRGPQQE